MLWADHVTRNTARSRDDVFEQVKAVFSEGEIVELTMMSGFFNFFNRFMDSLHMEVEDHSSVQKIMRRINLDGQTVQQYYRTLLDHWPETMPEPSGD